MGEGRYGMDIIDQTRAAEMLREIDTSGLNGWELRFVDRLRSNVDAGRTIAPADRRILMEIQQLNPAPLVRRAPDEPEGLRELKEMEDSLTDPGTPRLAPDGSQGLAGAVSFNTFAMVSDAVMRELGPGPDGENEK